MIKYKTPVFAMSDFEILGFLDSQLQFSRQSTS